MRRCSGLSALPPPQHHLLSPLGIHQSSLSTQLPLDDQNQTSCFLFTRSAPPLLVAWHRLSASFAPKVKGQLNDARAARSFISVKGRVLYADSGMTHGPAGSILYQSLTLLPHF